VKNHGSRIRRKYEEEPLVKCFQDQNELDILINHTEQISKKTWQRKIGGKEFTSQEIKDRYLHFIIRGLLKVYMLRIQDKSVSFLHGICYKNKFFVETIGYDPDYKKYSIGSYLTGKVIELYHNGRYSIMDWGVGNSDAKKLFCDIFTTVKDRYLVAPKLKLMALNTIRVIFLSIHIFTKKRWQI
jgi:hypothetical protein